MTSLYQMLLPKELRKPTGSQGTAVPDLIDVRSVSGEAIERTDGSFVALVEVEGEIFGLLSPEEQDLRLAAFAQILNGLPWPIEIVLFTEPVDIGDYLDQMAQAAGQTETDSSVTLADAFSNLGHELARDVLAEATVIAVTGRTGVEAATRAKRLGTALSSANFSWSLCSQRRMGEILLLTYGQDSKLNVGKALGGAQRAFKGTGGSIEAGATTFLDLLTPSAVTETPLSVDLGGIYARTFMAVSYPGTVSNGWLEPVLHFSRHHVQRRIAIHLRPIPHTQALSEINRRQSNLDLSARWAARQGKRADIYTQEALLDAEELRQDLARGVQRMFDVTVLVTLLSNSESALADAAAELKQEAAGSTLALRDVYLQQAPGFRSTTPLGLCLVDRKRPLPTLCVSTMFPFTAGELLHSRGHLWGVNLLTGNAVITDLERAASGHMLVVARTGSGKSLAFKVLATQSLVAGIEDVIVIDPSPAVDYERWTRALGGTFVRFSVNSDDRINPCEILLPSDLKLLDDEEFQRPVTTKVAFLKAILETMAYGDERMPGDMRARLEGPLYRVYEKFGMTDEWASIIDDKNPAARLHAKLSPTLRDVLEEIAQDPELRELALRLQPFVSGTLAMFSGQTNIARSSRLTVFNVYSLVQTGGTDLQRVTYALIAEHIRQQLVSSKRRTLVGIDEAHILFAKEETARFVSLLARTARKQHGRTALITQSITDLIGDPKTMVKVAGEEHARVYLGQVGYTLLLKNDKGADVELISSLFDLSDAEGRLIKMAPPGRGLLIAGGERAMLQVLAPDELMPLITTNGNEV